MASEQARHLAEILGDDAFFPANECPQGHKVIAQQAGDLCIDCFSINVTPFEAMRHGAEDPRWVQAAEDHPEWRIVPGEPKPLDTSYDTLEPFLIKVLDHSGMVFSTRRESSGKWRATFWRHGYGDLHGYGANTAAATMAAMLEVADRWRWGKQMIAP